MVVLENAHLAEIRPDNEVKIWVKVKFWIS